MVRHLLGAWLVSQGRVKRMIKGLRYSASGEGSVDYDLLEEVADYLEDFVLEGDDEK